MSHPSARLTVFSRQLLVKRVVIDGWPVATVAEQLGISRATGYKWVRRYRADGLPGLEDRSSRPHVSPSKTQPKRVRRIVALRWRERLGPVQIAGQLRMQLSVFIVVTFVSRSLRFGVFFYLGKEAFERLHLGF